MMQKKYKAFIDGTDLQYHVEGDANGAVVYPSVNALVESIAHDTAECGIAEVEIRFVRWARKPEDESNADLAAECNDMEAEIERLRVALILIEDAPTDWRLSVDANTERLREIARAALSYEQDEKEKSDVATD